MTGQSTTPGNSEFLRRALTLADGGRGWVSPNPLVGAVLVRGGEVIGEGFHAELGGLHAERAALADAAAHGEDPAGATMYVTLEPCAHQGRQPPCSEALIEARVGRVVIAANDPTTKAAGKGPEQLRAAGIEVEFAAPEAELATAARLQNQPFRKHGRTGIPWVLWKSAMSLDGRTTTPPGTSPWISGERSRALVHVWRGECDAIAVGIGTAIADDPLLTARPGGADRPAGGFEAAADAERRAAASIDVGGSAASPGVPRGADVPTAGGADASTVVDLPRQPTRVVFDSAARLPLDSRLLATTDEAAVLVVVAPDAELSRLEALRAKGAETIVVAGDSASERVTAALAELGRRGITSLMLEGGATLVAAFAAADQIDEARAFIAPMIFGGPMPAVPVTALRGGPSASEPAGEDTLITTRFKEW